ncbi:hypothetical protein K440DRAFT_558961 [Wilcoxina mikolae CBS 423.85]|nr:hypothetical protein K440DRAFT_558961 [Wilcoxina mikolae CBS 423.85]
MLSINVTDSVLILHILDSLKNEAIQFETRTFDGHFEANSEYQGAPNKSIDAKWSGITQLYNYGVDHETLVKANKTKGLVQWPGTDKYMVGLEMFHHLHCLNYIRMYTYMDYYQGINADMLAEPLEERTNHKDHCIEMIRQKLMCTPDLNVYSYHWLGNLNHPYTDFKTEHRCVNWDRLYEWSKTKIVRHGVLDKPEGVETLF